ncbi:MAG: hypothetical protein QNJ31_01435 [Candidatus Caenarcaniphilales bacterium]|nr:hypothetical protein [Candidatus Caenarcaniphilales bacterium]
MNIDINQIGNCYKINFLRKQHQINSTKRKSVFHSHSAKHVSFQRKGIKKEVIERLKVDSEISSRKEETSPLTDNFFNTKLTLILNELEKTHYEYVAVGSYPGKYFIIMNGQNSCSVITIHKKQTQRGHNIEVYPITEEENDQGDTRIKLSFKYYGEDNPEEKHFFFIPSSPKEKRTLVNSYQKLIEGNDGVPIINEWVYPESILSVREEVFQWSGAVGKKESS